jgi:hypothetical protein
MKATKEFGIVQSNTDGRIELKKTEMCRRFRPVTAGKIYPLHTHLKLRTPFSTGQGVVQ